MAWTFNLWIVSNVVSSVIIFSITLIGLIIMLCCCPKVFYGIVARLFRIKRCVIDVNHNIVRNNSELSTAYGEDRRIRRFISNMIDPGKTNKNVSTKRTDYIPAKAQAIPPRQTKQSRTWPSPVTVMNITSAEETSYKRTLKYQAEQNPSGTSSRSNARKNNFRQVVRSRTWKVNQRSPASCENVASSAKQHTTLNVLESHPTHQADPRVILNIYGKYLPLRKKRNQFVILMISSIVIAATVMAFWEGFVLASITVYQGRSCPDYGDMECFHGSDHIYFLCEKDNEINFTLLSTTGACFRWILLDQSITSFLTRIGVCTGLLAFFGSMTEVFIRILFVVYQPRRCVANGMRRVLEKTVGVNNITQPWCHCCIKFPIRVSPFYRIPYRYPVFVYLTIIIYLLITGLTVLAYIPLAYFQATVTSFTYIILGSTALLCFFTLVWIIWEMDEISRILPGGCINIKDILTSQAFKDLKNLLSIEDPKYQQEIMAESDRPQAEEGSDPKNKSAETKSQTSTNKEETGLTNK